MSIRIASHLYRNRHGTFYFRLIIPQDLRANTKRREIRLSLQTEQRQQAIYASLSLIADVPRFIADLRRMSEDDKKSLPDNYFKAWLAEKRKNIDLSVRLTHLEDALADAQYRLSQSVPRAKAHSGVKHAYDRGQLIGKREMEERLAFPHLPEKTPKFSELQAAYLRSLTSHRAKGGTKKPPTAKTLQEYGRSIELFITVMSDLHIGEIDRDIAGKYFSILKMLPANRSRKRAYIGKSIEELIALGDPPQSEVNVSKQIERISSMFKWALEEKRKWGIDANPFTGYGQAGDSETRRRPFTPDELKALLTHPSYVKRRFTNSYTFWLIPLATFTGARLGELAQLDIKDFIEVEGIQCIDINDIDAMEEQPDEKGRPKHVKNKNAKRLVPVHQALIDMGLLRYVERLRQRGEIYLFPELSRTRRDGPGHAASNWFQRFRHHVGIVAKQEAVFHSFRHGFISNILDSGVAPHLLAPIVGHEAELVTGQVYWNTKDATKRKPTVDAFKLPDEIVSLFPAVEDVGFLTRRRRSSLER